MKLTDCSVPDTSIFEVYLNISCQKEILFQKKTNFEWWNDLERWHKSDRWFEVTLGRFHVYQKTDIAVQLRNHSGTWKYGICWDFVWLKPVTLIIVRDPTCTTPTTECCSDDSNNKVKQKGWRRFFKRK